MTKEFRTYAESVEGRMIFSGTPDRRITPRGTISAQSRSPAPGTVRSTPRFITNSREAKSLEVSLFSMVYTEIAYGITYLHHRAFELEHLIIFSCRLAERLSDKRRDAGPHETEYTQNLVDAWYKAFSLYVLRHVECVPELERQLDDIEAMTKTKSLDRLRNRLEEIRSSFPRIQAEHGRSEPLTLDKAKDVILLKQEDFEYPLGASWLDFMCIRSKLEMGHHRLALMNKDLAVRGYNSSLSRVHRTISERIGRDLLESLLPAIAEIDPEMQTSVVIKSSLIDSIAGILADHVIDMAIENFNYAIGFTDMASGTTIQLRAIRTMMLQTPSSFIVPLTPDQVQFLTDITTHAIRSGVGR